ncbi:MAG: SRPBCC family protein [Rubrobacteraceae bacterium]
MKIQNEIEVSAPPDELFEILADVERVAPLLPGASIDEQEDEDTYKGTVKVKVGPITASYQGTLYFREIDYDNYRAVMEASGRETQGQGSAEATITAAVSGSDSQSVLSLDTDMEVRGKVAQFGRGAIGNVSQKLLDQFARNLESQVLSANGEEAPAEETDEPAENGQEADSTGEAAGGAQTAPTGRQGGGAGQPAPAPAGDDSLDMLSVVGMPALRQAAPVAAGLAVGLLVGNYLGSRKTLRAYRDVVRLLNATYGHSERGWRR